MRKLFYTRLALSNIRRNRKFYFPYMLTCIFTIAMYYIICALNGGDMLKGVKGEMVLRSYMAIGAVVIAIFAVIFLFYTNSFLTRRRRREFGLYNILGMEKRHIARVMLIETVFIALVTMGLGLLVGTGLAKLVALGTMKLVRAEAIYGFEFVPSAANLSAATFAVIFALSYLMELLRLGRANAIDLLKSDQRGEREPKSKWIITILGAACLGGGYYLAVTTESPVTAMLVFMVAVILVIIGTYLLFTSGSIVLLKALRANKRYYYKPNHFISVSGMIYRMKQNAAGLATICILSTMVLVMVSATASLTIGSEAAVQALYPHEFSFSPEIVEETDAHGHQVIVEALARHGVEPTNYVSFRDVQFAGKRVGNTFDLTVQSDQDNLAVIAVMPYEDFISIMPKAGAAQPEAGSVLVYGPLPEGDTLNINGLSLNVAGRLNDFPGTTSLSSAMSTVADVFGLVVRDMDDLNRIAQIEQDAYQHDASAVTRTFAFDIPLEGKALEAACTDVKDALKEAYSGSGYSYNGPRYEGRANQNAMSGGLLFLGIFLGILFVMAMVLMMYYKQISEGYEDRTRYAIMRKVGLDDSEIRRSIQSQVITVFFLPLIMACVHTSVAFFIIRRVLMVFGLTNRGLLMACTGVSMAVFAVFYIITYMVTASVYYRIVARDAR